MIEILFRAKDDLRGMWLYGYPVIAADKEAMYFFTDEKNNNFRKNIAMRKTLGQYTGLTDKNGTKIFEGDIVAYEDAEADYEGYHDNVFVNRGEVYIGSWEGIYFSNRQTVEMEDLYESETMVDCEVIGNKHDNPELLNT